MLRRLALLFHHGYLDRPRAQIEYYRAGSAPMVYAIGNTAVPILESEFGISRRQVDWTAKNRAANRFFIQHALSVADVLVALEIACANSSQRPVTFSRSALPDSGWKVTLGRDRTTIGVVPDAIFGLGVDDQSEPTWIFLEVDRGTMPINRLGLKQTSIRRKLLAYHELWRQGLVRDSFPRFRVLTVTTSSERATNMIEATQLLGHGHGLFLFVDRKSFLSSSNPLFAPHRNGRGDPAMLIE